MDRRGTPTLVKGFLGGFVVATLIWGAAFYAYRAGLFEDPSEEIASAPEESAEAVAEESTSMRRRRRRNRRQKRRSKRTARMERGAESGDREPSRMGGISESGDDLGEVTRELDLGGSGGEAQLTSSQIDNVVESTFPRIRRCLVLVDSDAPVTGRLRVGLRIAGTGRVSRVNLRGPSAVSSGECGDCIRRAARGMRFPSFDGPDQLTSFPITLE